MSHSSIENHIQNTGQKMKTEEIIIKTEAFYAIQNLRIQAQLRIKAFIRDKRLDKKEAKKLHLWNDEILKSMEHTIKKEMETLIADIPIYDEFFKKIKGIGPCLSGSLYSGIYDISRFATVSKLWKYCGQDVVDGEAPRRQKGKKITWNPFLRMTMHKITDSFIKQNPEKSQYRRLYNEAKEYYKKKFPQWAICWHCKGRMVIKLKKVGKKITEVFVCSKCGKNQAGEPHPTRKTKEGKLIYRYTRGHINNMAKRKVAKIFLQHLFVKWWEIDHGVVPSKPWILEHGGHVDYIECEEA